ncbi:conserved hypothetical protein [Xenorhabdus szentirmaii DSM 16338]|uniref:Uncharacterized protein n=1 Tax=Xenorhabdus szentirmaii DSM 16338 TaxID=1427518 RepID=W1IXN1_9GAMM|nr:conserved hypothetical protein [Xenorhabdus szentirmaii DSM 16338]
MIINKKYMGGGGCLIFFAAMDRIKLVMYIANLNIVTFQTGTLS